MEMPKLTEQHKRYRALVGEWKGEENMHPSPWDPKGGTATSLTKARLDLGDFFLIMDYEQTRDGQVTYRGHGVMGWDPRQKKYTMHWFDVMGGDPGPPAPGTWEGNRLCFQHQHHMGHSRYTYEFQDDRTYTFKLEQSRDGKSWSTFVDGTYKRSP